MAEATTQTAVKETDAPAKPATEATDAQAGDDLDKWIAEYNREAPATRASPSTPEPKPNAGSDTEKFVSRDEFDRVVKSQTEERVSREIEQIVKTVKGDTKVSERAVRGWLEEVAKEEKWLADAYFRPKTAGDKDKALRWLKREFGKEFSPSPVVDENATADVEAVAAAVRGASTRAPEGKAPNYAGMNNAEYREAVKKEHGFDPGV